MMMVAVTGTMAHSYEYSDYEWDTYNGRHYAITKDYGNWQMCRAEAVAVGGDLVNINDGDENDWLSETFQGYYAQGDPGNHNVSLVWIGFLRDSPDANDWYWSCGDPVTFSPPWYDGGTPHPGSTHAYLHTDTHHNPGTWWEDTAYDGSDPNHHVRGIIEFTNCAFSDDFEDGVIEPNLWVVGGGKGGVGGPGSGSGQWYNEEIIAPDGYLQARATTPVSGNTYGSQAWTRTLYSFNDGKDWIINFKWEADNQASQPWHADYYLIEITDGRTDWQSGLYVHPDSGILPGTVQLYLGNDTEVSPQTWSIYINHAKQTATLYKGPNRTGIMCSTKTLDESLPWYLRFITTVGTSSGFPAKDCRINLYDFSVTALPRVLSPNGGEELIAGQTHTITWTASPGISNVSIEYSANNGGDWVLNDPCTPNDGEYDWMVPEVTSNQCLLRISDVADPCVYDISDDVFTIYECQGPIIGDVNNDCYFNLLDFALLAAGWLDCGNPFDPLCNPTGIELIYIDDPGVPGHEGFTGFMGKYEVTNAQYCQFLNSALASGDVVLDPADPNIVVGGPDSEPNFVGQVYYDLAGAGDTFGGATNGGAARINHSGGVFSVDSGFEDHPVTYVSWYGATAFCNYYGYRLPTEWEWQAVADFDGTYTYGCGTTINNSIANYISSTHPDGTTVVDSFGDPSGYGYGMCGMTGNTCEWCRNWHHIHGANRSSRGGSWQNYAAGCEVSDRHYGSPNGTYCNYGFRVCR